MLCELRPDKCCWGVMRSGLFPNPRHVYPMSPSDIRLVPDSGRNPCLISWRQDFGKPIGASLVRNRGTSRFSGLPGRAVSADPIEENIRLSAGPLQVVGLTKSKPRKKVEFSRISAMRTHVRKNPHPTRVKDRSWDSTFAGRSNAPIGYESQDIYEQCRSLVGGRTSHPRISKIQFEDSSGGAVRLAEAIEK